jgi:hypothetical protein
MQREAKTVKQHAAKLVTGGIALACLALAIPDGPDASHLADVGKRIRLDLVPIANIDNAKPWRRIRDVHPELVRADAWISSVGAGVALADVDGDRLPNDLCIVDPRNDSVTIMPVPGSGARFPAFLLDAPHDGYDPATVAPMGCLLGDLNEDGRTDALVYYWGRTPLAFLDATGAAAGAGAATPVEIAEPAERWFTNAATLADVDGDGHPDLIFGNYFADGARILDPSARHPTRMQHSMSRAYNGGRNRLFLWASAARGSLRYRDASESFEEPMRNGWTLALGAQDLTGDLLPEIYVANDFGPDRLLLNRSAPGRPAFQIVEGRRGLATPRSKVLGRDSFKGMGIDFADLNRDGTPDIAVSNIAREYALIESHFLFVSTGDSASWAAGRAPYKDESSSRGTWISDWAWGIRFVDLDNDGRQEIVQATGFVSGEINRWPELQELAMGNDELLADPRAWPKISAGDDLSGQGHDRLFVADDRGRYHDAWRSLGLDTGTVSRGIATGDLFGDGRQSVVIARQWMPSVLLRNRSEAGASLILELRVPGAVAASRPAIGAAAKITLPGGRRAWQQVDGGSGHSGARAPEIHFGLGDMARHETVEVELSWRDRDGAHRTALRLPPGRHRILLDDAGGPTALSPRRNPGEGA